MKYNFTDEQKRHIISIVLSAFVSLIVALGVALGYPVTVTPGAQGEIGAQGLSQIRFSNPVVFQRVATFNQATTQTGALTVAGLVNADGGIAVDTSAFTVADTSGNTAIAGTLTVGGGYGTTGCTVSAAGAVSCNGALIVGNTATFTDTLNMSNAVISNIGNASTDFDLSGGLTAAGGFTGTVNTAAQTSITSLGTQAATLNMGNNVISNIGNASTDFDTSGGLTAAGGFTGTINTAAQPNITSVGTLPTLTVGNLTATGTITVSTLVSSTVNVIAASGTITELTTTNITGTLATAAQTNVTSLGAQASALNMNASVINNIGNAGTDFDLSGGLTAAGGFTGTVNTAAQGSITSLGTQASALNMGNAVINNIGSASTDFDLSGGLTVAGGITGTVNTAAQASITQVGNLITTTVGSGGVGSLTAYAPVVMTDTLNVTGLTTLGTATATTLQVGGVSFSGAMKYGTAATYVAGTSITHGFATTPTVCLVTPMPITGTLSITTTGFSSDTGMTAVPIYWMCGQ